MSSNLINQKSVHNRQGDEWQTFRTAVNQVMMQPKNTKQYVEPIDRVTQEFIDRCGFD